MDPQEVKTYADRLTLEDIAERLTDLHPAPWVTLSGGNPAIHDLTNVLEALKQCGFRVAVETQGAKWRSWLVDVDMLIVSPKPPSSGMATDEHREETQRFMTFAERSVDPLERAIKIVVFDEVDLLWADAFMVEWPWPQKYLSVGTDRPFEDEDLAFTRKKVCDRYRWLCEKTPYLRSEVTVYPQLHVLAYGHARGV